MAHVVAFCSQKGGVGKSGLAQAFAVTAAKEAERVLLADLDDGQHTSVVWGQVRAANGFQPAVEVKPVPRLRVFDYKADYDVLIIDAPGWADELTAWLAGGAHFTVLPAKPTPEDLPPTIKLMQALRARGLADYRFGVVLNEVLKDKEVEWAKGELASQGFKPLAGFLRTVASYREVRKIGKSCIETAAASLNTEAGQVMGSITRALAHSEKQMTLEADRQGRGSAGKALARGRERG